ncbi:MAG: AAA family ATPase [Paludibacteraceae bacterium]|nr:AAA family ATPase [Paludibacteraceae bacterium]
MGRIFQRKLYGRLLSWKKERKGKTALLIEGARRVGKSTLVEEFARKEYESYLLIDFNKASKQVKNLFDDLMDIDMLFLQLQAIFHVSLVNRRSVIIFDEVQQCPKARQAIKYLVQDGRYDYIETGSLISIKKNTKDITIPSEEERVQMFPMDMEEFRWAMGDEATVPLLKQFYEKKIPLAAAHRTKMRELRLYMLVGGMPQAVNEFLETNDLSKVDVVKRDIIRLYLDDFQKLDESGRIAEIFKNIPAQLSANSCRYRPLQVIGSTASEKLKELLRNLEDSKTAVFQYHSNDPNVGMTLTKDITRFKIFLCDTGLFITLAFWDKDFTENIIYQKLLSDKLSANLGYVYENLVAQLLVSAGNQLFFYTWPRDEKHNYEIDFLLSRGYKIQPIEVKSSGYSTHASLDEFYRIFHERIDKRFLIYTKDLKVEDKMIYLPMYMTTLI